MPCSTASSAMTFQSYLLLSYFFFFMRCCPLSLSIKSMARFGGTHQILMDFINASSTGGGQASYWRLWPWRESPWLRLFFAEQLCRERTVGACPKDSEESLLNLAPAFRDVPKCLTQMRRASAIRLASGVSFTSPLICFRASVPLLSEEPLVRGSAGRD